MGQDKTGSEGHEGNLGNLASAGNLGNLASAKGQDGYFPSITGQEGYLLAKGTLPFVDTYADIAIARTAVKAFFIINLD